ncbi:ribonuclease E activity regulator RraA [bacterium]|nr:ribonuclease E activity regulator RraA [bacterium]MBU1957921.1 ribonuclease E activity regulator RraA [bacterium]
MQFSTADLCDEQGAEVKVLEQQLNSYGGRDCFYGEIVTIKLDEDNRGLVAMLRDEEGKGRVAVVDVDAKFCAVVGDNLMGFAAKNGWVGIIINGYVRDTRITKNIDAGLFALGTCPRRSAKEAAFERGITLNFGGVDFNEGEWIYADEDGVILSKTQLTIIEI